MMVRQLMKLYPFQVFRHRVYLPWLSILGFLGDIKRGVTTQKVIELNKLGVDSHVGSRFETISYGKLTTALEYAHKEGFDKFLDIGCGLGRSLVVASEVGFNDLYGVDISSILIKSCQKNLSKKNISANLSCSDVDDYEMPPGRLVVYLFNPFGEERMTQLVEEFYARDDETLVIYHNPKYSGCFNKGHKIKELVWNHFGLYRERAYLYLIPASIQSEENQ
jgi:SAM-dependent methyltransferase